MEDFAAALRANNTLKILSLDGARRWSSTRNASGRLSLARGIMLFKFSAPIVRGRSQYLSSSPPPPLCPLPARAPHTCLFEIRTGRQPTNLRGRGVSGIWAAPKLHLDYPLPVPQPRGRRGCDCPCAGHRVQSVGQPCVCAAPAFPVRHWGAGARGGGAARRPGLQHLLARAGLCYQPLPRLHSRSPAP